MSNQPDRDRVTKKAVALLDSVEHLSSPSQINEWITDAILEAKIEELEHMRRHFENASWSQKALDTEFERRKAKLRSQKSDTGRDSR